MFRVAIRKTLEMPASCNRVRGYESLLHLQFQIPINALRAAADGLSAWAPAP